MGLGSFSLYIFLSFLIFLKLVHVLFVFLKRSLQSENNPNKSCFQQRKMCVIFHGERWVLVPRTSPCPLEHINRKKKLERREKQPISQQSPTLSSRSHCFYLQEEGLPLGSSESRLSPFPHCSWSPRATDADTSRKPTGGGKWG